MINQWNFSRMKVGTMWAANTAKAMGKSCDAGAITFPSSGVVRYPITAHGYVAGSTVRCKTATPGAHDGIFVIKAVAANTFDVYSSVTTALADASGINVGPAIGQGCDGIGPDTAFMLIDVRFTLSAAGDATENFTATQDCAAEDNMDNQFITEDTNGVRYYSSVVAGLGLREYSRGDYIDFAWANGGTARNWGIEVKYGVM